MSESQIAMHDDGSITITFARAPSSPCPSDPTSLTMRGTVYVDDWLLRDDCKSAEDARDLNFYCELASRLSGVSASLLERLYAKDFEIVCEAAKAVLTRTFEDAMKDEDNRFEGDKLAVPLKYPPRDLDASELKDRELSRYDWPAALTLRPILGRDMCIVDAIEGGYVRRSAKMIEAITGMPLLQVFRMNMRDWWRLQREAERFEKKP